MISFSEWIIQFVGEEGDLGALAFDVYEDWGCFPVDAKSLDVFLQYAKSNWNSNDDYLTKLKDAFKLYEKEIVAR